jgi:hypothetical protein
MNIVTHDHPETLKRAGTTETTVLLENAGTVCAKSLTKLFKEAPAVIEGTYENGMLVLRIRRTYASYQSATNASKAFAAQVESCFGLRRGCICFQNSRPVRKQY